MKKRVLKGTRKANTMMALVCSITVSLTGPRAHSQNLVVDGDTTTIDTDTSAGNIVVGTNSGDTGTLTVTFDTIGDFSTLTGAGTLTVGSSGTGTLNVDGGNVSNTGTGYIGLSTGSNGTVNVLDGTWANGGNLTVGYAGTGTLNVTGGTVSNAGGVVGLDAGSNGTVNVGYGTWANSGDLKVGDAGTGILTIVDSGLVTVSGNLTRGSLGTINLNAGGTLQIGTGGTTGALLGGTGALTNDGSLIFKRSDASTYSGVLSGSGVVEKQGTGTLTLSGPNTYSGGTTLTAGTLALGNAGAIGSSGTISFGGGTLQASGSNTTDYSARFSNADSQQYKIDTNNLNLTLASDLTSSGGSFTKRGLGTLTLSGTNTYSGGTTLTGGTLALGSAGAIGSAGTISFGGGTLQATAGNTTDYSARFSNTNIQQYKIDTNSQNLTLASALTSVGGSFTKLGAGTLTLTGANTFSGGILISEGTLSVGSGSTTGSIISAVENNSILAFNRSDDALTYTAVISGTGAVTKSGAGTLTLTGANTYTGGTTISAGTLSVGSGSNSGSITGDVANSGTLTFNRSGVLTYDGIVSGTGAVTKSGAGTLTLSGANTYTGGTTVSAGTLQFAKAASLYNGNTTLWTAANLTVASGATAAFNVGGSNEFTSGNLDTLVALGSSTNGFQSGSVIGLDTSSGNFSYDSVIANPNGGINGRSLTKLGSNSLILSGANTYTGATTVSAGVLNIQNADALGTTAAGTSVTSGAALQIEGGITVGAEALALRGGGITNTGALRNISGTNTYAGLVTLGASTRINSDAGTLTLSNTGTITGSSVVLTVGGAGNTRINSILGWTGNLVKDGSGTLTLTRDNTYSGATAVNAGVLNIQSANALGVTTGSTNVTVGAALQIEGGITTAAEALTLRGTGVNTDGALRNISGDNTYAGLVTLGEATRINSDAGTLTLSHAGTITGATRGLTVGGAGNTTIASIIGTTSGTLTKDGAGTLTLSGANTYTGATTVSAGILNLRNATGLGTTVGSTTVSNGATLQLQGGITVGAEALSLNGSAASGQTGALVNVSGTNTYGGAVTVTSSSSISAASGSVLNLTGGVVKNGTVATFNGGGTINVNTVAISGSSVNSDLVIDGTTVNVGVASTYNGPTFIRNSGTLNANVTDALPTANGRTAVTFDGTGTSVLSLGAAQSVASLTSAGAATVTLGANTLTVGTSTGSTSFDGIIGGTGGLIKDGTSTQVLTGANTYSGATTVSAGTLLINGNQSTANGAVSVSAAATLGGTGTVGGATAVNSTGVHSVGAVATGGANGVAKQTFSSSVTYDSGSIFEWNLAAVPAESGRGTSYDAVNATSLGSTTGAIFRVVLNGAQDFTSTFWDSNRTWSDIYKTGDAGSNLSIASIFSGDVQYYNGGGSALTSIGIPTTQGAFTFSGSDLKWTAVPEPSSALAGLLIGAGLLRRRRTA